MGFAILAVALGGVLMFMTTDAQLLTKAIAAGLLVLSFVIQFTPLGELITGFVATAIQVGLAIWMMLYFKVGDLRTR